jgi:hypothetical protein
MPFGNESADGAADDAAAAEIIRPDSMQRIGRSRLPPANTL